MYFEISHFWGAWIPIWILKNLEQGLAEYLGICFGLCVVGEVALLEFFETDLT